MLDNYPANCLTGMAFFCLAKQFRSQIEANEFVPNERAIWRDFYTIKLQTSRLKWHLIGSSGLYHRRPKSSASLVSRDYSL